MKKLLLFLLASVVISFVFPRQIGAGGTYYCNPDPVSGGCVNNCTEGDVPNCTADPSGLAACLGPYQPAPCIDNPNPPQPGDCPGTCVDTWACLNVIPGYSGKCGAGKECCSGALPGGNAEKGGLTCAGDGGGGINTAIGCIPIEDPNAFLGFILKWAIGVGGGIAFLLVAYSSFMIMSSSGNPDRLKAGQELLTSALMGVILMVFAVFILKVIGVDILDIPGFATISPPGRRP